MRLEGSVAGRQFDRIGYVDVGGVRMLTLSTPEPSVDGIRWHVEKDVTDLAPLLADPQQVQAFIGNVVDSTYTGVIHVTVDLDFYTTGTRQPRRPGRPTPSFRSPTPPATAPTSSAR